MAVDWTNLERVRRALASGDAEAAASAFNSTRPAHRATVAALSAQELATLLKNDLVPGKLAWAAANLGETDIEAALRLYDALLEVPLDDLGLFPPCNGTYWLAIANAKAVDKVRTRRYLKRWERVAKKLTMIYLNAAELRIALGQHDRAIALLRDAVLQGDPTIARQLRDKTAPDQLAPLRRHPGFDKLLALEPVVPVGLRGLHAAISMNLDDEVADAAKACDLVDIYDSFDEEVGDLEMHHGHQYSLGARGRRAFKTFGMLKGDSDLAFWERTPGQPLVERPIVIFGSRGKFAVCATDFDGFLALLGHDCSLCEIESVGFHFNDTNWSPPRKSELRKLVANKRFIVALARWAPRITKRKPAAERAAALALIPDFMTTIRKLIKVRPPAVTKKAAKRRS